ncbi:MAG: kelch repeat-containing protein, partial [Thermoanaerobaculia bacterium]
MKKSIQKFAFLLGAILLISLNSKAQTLSFEERLDCKRTVEKIYWEHRIWPSENKTPKPPFEKIVPDSILSQKVEDEIRKENALEILWQKPITGKQIQAEIERIIKNTKEPEKLREIFEALGNDPYKIAQGFALPILADRLIRNYYSKDERFHISLKEKALSEIKAISSVEQMKNTSGIYSEVIFVKDENLIDKKGKAKNEVEEILCDEAEWERLQNLPAGKVSFLMEDEFQFYSEAVLEKVKDKIKVGYIIFKKKPFEEWWEENKQSFPLKIKEIAFQYNIANLNLNNSGCTNDDMWIPFFPAPERRAFHTAVWTGTEMIVWGGAVSTLNNPAYFVSTGGKYNPLTDTWTPVSKINAPSPRRYHTAVWTGNEMIVWGGDVGGGNKTNTGGRYNPFTDTWAPTSTIGAPSPRKNHNAVWTGDRMIVWGGMDSTGEKYDPTTDTWEPISTINAPSPREGNIAVWNETELVIWGGYNGSNYLNDGYMYHPQNDTWSPLSSYFAATPRAYHTAVFSRDKDQMIIWGGYDGSKYLRDGYIYDFDTNTWAGISNFNSP